MKISLKKVKVLTKSQQTKVTGGNATTDEFTDVTDLEVNTGHIIIEETPML